MRKISTAVIFSILCSAAFSQGTNFYSFFVNVVNQDFKFPLIGFVNVAAGEHNNAQIGFVNYNSRSFKGLQAGFVNVVGDSLTGVQLSFINTVAGNTAGLQAGFVNTTKKMNGAQLGFVNTAITGAYGFQLGFINTARQKLKGFQLGFVNYADTLESGIPIGFLSIVKRGGYQAVEYSFSEFYPVTVGFKTGVEKFYTAVYFAYNPFQEQSLNSFAFGFGIGSIIPIKNSFFFNPEINHFNTLPLNDNGNLTSLTPFFGYNFNRHFSIAVAPAVTWNASYDGAELLKPFFNIKNFEINKRNTVVVGARLGVRYRF